MTRNEFKTGSIDAKMVPASPPEMSKSVKAAMMHTCKTKKILKLINKIKLNSKNKQKRPHRRNNDFKITYSDNVHITYETTDLKV